MNTAVSAFCLSSSAMGRDWDGCECLLLYNSVWSSSGMSNHTKPHIHRSKYILWLDTDRKVLNLIPVNIWEINCPQAYSVAWNDWMKCRRQMVTNWQPNILNLHFSTHLSWPFIYSLVLVSYAEICLALSGTHIEEIHTACTTGTLDKIKVKILYILNHL